MDNASNRYAHLVGKIIDDRYEVLQVKGIGGMAVVLKAKDRLKNRTVAIKMLRTKLYDMKQSAQDEAIASARRSQVGTGDRSERIRTYNYPQGRITDHRIGLTLYSMEAFLNGEINTMIDALIAADTAAKLSQAGE